MSKLSVSKFYDKGQGKFAVTCNRSSSRKKAKRIFNKLRRRFNCMFKGETSCENG